MTTSAMAQLFSIKPNNKQILHASVQAQEQFATLTQEQTDFIFSEIAKVANKARLPLAVMAAEETGMGCMEDKVIKNSLACELICDRYKNSKTCGLIREDQPHGLRVYANPVGPVCAITPVTNPTSTAISKCLMLAKTRNAGVFLPHPHVRSLSIFFFVLHSGRHSDCFFLVRQYRTLGRQMHCRGCPHLP